MALNPNNYSLAYDLQPGTSASMTGYGIAQGVPAGGAGAAKSAGLGKGGWAASGPLISPGVGNVIGSVIDLGFSIWDYSERKKEMERLEAKADARYEQQWKRDEERYQTQLGLTQSTMRANRRNTKKEWDFRTDERDYNRSEREKEWKWRSDDKNYQRGMEIVNNFRSNIAKQPQLEQHLMSIWPKQQRRVA